MIGWDSTDPVWDRCGWLGDLRGVPADAVWPRLMSGPHPTRSAATARRRCAG